MRLVCLIPTVKNARKHTSEPQKINQTNYFRRIPRVFSAPSKLPSSCHFLMYRRNTTCCLDKARFNTGVENAGRSCVRSFLWSSPCIAMREFGPAMFFSVPANPATFCSMILNPYPASCTILANATVHKVIALCC